MPLDRHFGERAAPTEVTNSRSKLARSGRAFTKVPSTSTRCPKRGQEGSRAGLILLVAVLQAPNAVAEETSAPICIAPVVPDTALPVEVLDKFRRELVAEFEHYFRETSTYIACLDAERTAILEEAHAVTLAYAAFLAIIPKDENR